VCIVSDRFILEERGRAVLPPMEECCVERHNNWLLVRRRITPLRYNRESRMDPNAKAERFAAVSRT
jgi:hypothetical protein